MLNDKEKEYLKLVYKQYCDALGYDYQGEYKDSELVSWILKRKELGELYYLHLQNLGLKPRIDDTNTIEVNKGKYDSVVDKTNMTIITPYNDSFTKKGKIIPGKFQVNYSTPTIVTQNRVLDLSKLTNYRIMTHNPYHSYDIEGWEKLPNTGKNDILIGVFGEIQDKDYQAKLEYLKHIKQLLRSDSYISDSFTINDAYFGYVATNTKNDYNEKTKICTLKEEYKIDL